MGDPAEVRRVLTRVHRAEAGRLHGALMRLTGSLDRAEDALQDAIETALARWPAEGIPSNPAAWLTTTARRKALDHLRRAATRARKADEVEHTVRLEHKARAAPAPVDDELPLIFTCCHPALPLDAQVGLTLRALCGLSTAEIARAFLVPEPTLAQRLVRAKRKLAALDAPFAVPPPDELPARLDAVLAVVYLLFNEGYAATAGDAHIRRELCAEAIRLGRLVHRLLPDEAEAQGLLALMLLQDARRDARLDPDGGIVLLAEQDRGRWHRDVIDEGITHVRAALARKRAGPYQIQAAIAALHGEATRAEDTDWAQIEALYAALYRLQPSPVVALNHAVAVAMHHGPAAALPLLDRLAADGALARYPYLPAARADLLRRLGRFAEAADAYRAALALTQNAAEQRYLAARIDEAERAARRVSGG